MASLRTNPGLWLLAGLALPLSACAGNAQIAAGEEGAAALSGSAIAVVREEYNLRILFVSPERLRKLARTFGRNERAGALAMWRADENGAPLGRCTIYLRRGASYDMLSHETRHCLEGQYHPRTSHMAVERRLLPGLRPTQEDSFRRGR